MVLSIISFFYFLHLFLNKSYTHEIYPENTNERIVLIVHYTGTSIAGNTDFTINVYDKKNNLLLTYENFNATYDFLQYKINKDTLIIFSYNDYIFKQQNKGSTKTKIVINIYKFLETERDSLDKLGFKTFPIDTAKEKININITY